MKQDALVEAFTLFSEESKKLEKSYLALQKEVKEKSNDLSEIVSHLAEGLIFVTLQGKISFFNYAAEKITQVSSGQAFNQLYSSFFSDSAFGFSMEEALQACQINKKIYLTFGNGKEISVSASSIPKRGIVLVLTEMELAEKSVERNERLKELGQMAASLAHEIRNPLGGIEGFASLLARDLKESPSLKEMAERILDGTRSLNRLVTNILNYSHPSDVHFAKADLVVLVEDILTHFQHDKASKKCHFEKGVSTCPVLIDKDLLKIALINLLRNANEATSESLALRILQSGSEAIIEVQDFGPGIAPEHLKRLFTPFFTTKPQGTGLGLVEAHKAVLSIGGKIEVASTSAQGTTFTLKFQVIPSDD